MWMRSVSLCYYDIWHSCSAPPWRSQRERQVGRVMHHTERCIEMRPRYLFGKPEVVDLTLSSFANCIHSLLISETKFFVYLLLLKIKIMMISLVFTISILIIKTLIKHFLLFTILKQVFKCKWNIKLIRKMI